MLLRRKGSRREKNWICCVRTTNVQTSLHIRAIWFAPLSFALWTIRYSLTCNMGNSKIPASLWAERSGLSRPGYKSWRQGFLGRSTNKIYTRSDQTNSWSSMDKSHRWMLWHTCLINDSFNTNLSVVLIWEDDTILVVQGSDNLLTRTSRTHNFFLIKMMITKKIHDDKHGTSKSLSTFQ